MGLQGGVVSDPLRDSEGDRSVINKLVAEDIAALDSSVNDLLKVEVGVDNMRVLGLKTFCSLDDGGEITVGLAKHEADGDNSQGIRFLKNQLNDNKQLAQTPDSMAAERLAKEDL